MSTSKPKQNGKAATVARMQAIITGLQKRFPNGNFTLGNQTFTTASLVTLFQGVIDATTKVNASQASAKVAVTGMRTAQANVGPVFLVLKRWLVSTYGTAADILGDFGLEPPKAPARGRPRRRRPPRRRRSARARPAGRRAGNRSSPSRET